MNNMSINFVELDADPISGEAVGCQNVVKKLSIVGTLSQDSKILSLAFNIHHQSYSEDTTIVFEYLPKVENAEYDGYYVQNRGGYRKSDKLVFGKINTVNENFFINTNFPLSGVAIQGSDNSCAEVINSGSAYHKPVYIDFAVQHVQTCSVNIPLVSFDIFCNSYDSIYKIFSILIRIRR